MNYYLKIDYYLSIKYKIIVLIILVIYLNNQKKKKLLSFNYSCFSLCSKNITDQNYIYFEIINLTYTFSLEYLITKIKYEINCYNKNHTLIKPSDLALFHQLQILCHTKYTHSNVLIDSMANIKDNRNFYCIEFIKINTPIQLGIKISSIPKNSNNIFYFKSKEFNYNNVKNMNDNNFNALIINKNYKKFFKKKYNFLKLKKSFYMPPFFILKNDITIKDNLWNFRNFYNNYFCFCKGVSCLYNKNIYQKCKYKFYLNIIDNNRYLYNKTDFLLVDFIKKNVEPIDGYPIFKEMIKQNLNAHYMTKDDDIFKNFCNNKKYASKVFPVIYENKINGDFLERYIEIVLKLKVVVGVHSFYSIDNLFYNIEYITYIFLGHGASYFKQFLYKDYLSHKKYDKIVIPPSSILISLAKKYGWKDKNIIKICLPRWDNYNILKDNNANKELNKNISIFLMFTWRKNKKGHSISKLYFSNTFNLLNNKKLNKMLIEKNITFYFTYHHSLKQTQDYIFRNKKYIKYINQSQISECLRKSSLLVTDFSSIAFDFIYQKKPLIIYIPDANDPLIESNYNKHYFDIINGLRNNTIYFENRIFNLEKAVNKIIYYINNNFKVDKKLNNFFKLINFKFKDKRHTTSFINYLKNVK
jgi:CDP-glycerol glycerophosphotransferase (TagB/SpsB family)